MEFTRAKSDSGGVFGLEHGSEAFEHGSPALAHSSPANCHSKSQKIV
jgi:hypothetical protein